MTIYIVYKTTNLINNKFYIGKHKQSSEDFDGYLGSGVNITRAIEKYGKDAFIRETLATFTDEKECYEAEAEFLKDVWNLRECYNQESGGRGSYNITEETRERMKNSCIGRKSSFKGKSHSDETKKIISEKVKAKTASIHSPENVKKRQESRNGYRHTEETKQKIRKGNIGKAFSHSDETKTKLSLALKDRPSPMKGKEPWNKGIEHSDETKSKMAERAKNRKKYKCPHCHKEVTGGNFKRWHGDNCKFKYS